MTGFVNVTIVGMERVRYRQTRRMPKDEFERLNALLGSDRRGDRLKAARAICDMWIDPSDIAGGERFRLQDSLVAEDGA